MHTTSPAADARQAFPPPLSQLQLGPTVTPGVCAYAPREGCGTEEARFYLVGWRCGKHGPQVATDPLESTAGAES
jgi:hypothetical protein